MLYHVFIDGNWELGIGKCECGKEEEISNNKGGKQLRVVWYHSLYSVAR